MDMCIIYNWSTGKKYTGAEAIEALRDIINNDSKDYSYNKRMAQYTVKYFNLSL